MCAVCAGLICMALNGCQMFENEARQGVYERGDWGSSEPRTYTTADVRMVISRKHPVTNQEVTCTEPSPDVAKALSVATNLTLKGGSGAATGQVGLSGSAAEAMAELAGRSTALLALRDGLYRACESYLNGAIGSDAYALILTRYGQLMTTLSLGEDIRGTVAGAGMAGAAASSPAPAPVSVPAEGASSAPSDSAPAAKNSSPAAKQKKVFDQADPRAGLQYEQPRFIKVMTEAVADLGRSLRVAADSAAAPAGASAPTPAGSSPQAQGKQANKSKNKNTQNAPAADSSPNAPQNKGSTDNSGGAGSVPAAAVAALALARMNEDYFDLDMDSLHQLLTACVNEYDPTRARTWISGQGANTDSTIALDQRLGALTERVAALENPPKAGATPPAAINDSVTAGQNAFLRKICPTFANLDVLIAAEIKLLPAYKAAGHPGPVIAPDSILKSASVASSDSAAGPAAAAGK